MMPNPRQTIMLRVRADGGIVSYGAKVISEASLNLTLATPGKKGTKGQNLWH